MSKSSQSTLPSPVRFGTLAFLRKLEISATKDLDLRCISLLSIDDYINDFFYLQTYLLILGFIKVMSPTSAGCRKWGSDVPTKVELQGAKTKDRKDPSLKLQATLSPKARSRPPVPMRIADAAIVELEPIEEVEEQAALEPRLTDRIVLVPRAVDVQKPIRAEPNVVNEQDVADHDGRPGPPIGSRLDIASRVPYAVASVGEARGADLGYVVPRCVAVGVLHVLAGGLQKPDVLLGESSFPVVVEVAFAVAVQEKSCQVLEHDAVVLAVGLLGTNQFPNPNKGGTPEDPLVAPGGDHQALTHLHDAGGIEVWVGLLISFRPLPWGEDRPRVWARPRRRHPLLGVLVGQRCDRESPC
ncbi:MAG: hypothetical protein A2Z11_03785 [Candidatus Woykebacteria bacterium RBG_16_43_9]|uniref:Uncharacterized protein n=1 Tax=Candidatus Woykebacteria bacterium RBG_16_43_9 TaxID=1802596 RepID=A0A1G1WDG6_9BACT|nr:MAG: hypothetical protein A2Z11_03785 [Candidatus Woykebacteria bacterium RBG_16_43_9]